MKTKPKYSKYVKFTAYAAIIVLLNVVGLTLFFRMDLTANNIYSISKGSQNVVSTLSEPLTINVFFTKNLPAPYNNIERYLHDLLESRNVKVSRLAYGIPAGSAIEYADPVTLARALSGRVNLD